jgi:hypothetical protein
MRKDKICTQPSGVPRASDGPDGPDGFRTVIGWLPDGFNYFFLILMVAGWLREGAGWIRMVSGW